MTDKHDREEELAQSLTDRIETIAEPLPEGTPACPYQEFIHPPGLMLHRSEMKRRPDSAKRRIVALASFRILTVLCSCRECCGRGLIRRATVRPSRRVLRRAAIVAVVQAADLWNGDDPAERRWRDRPGVR
jgi:hypothetical protein